jgi:hypothetical protein
MLRLNIFSRLNSLKNHFLESFTICRDYFTERIAIREQLEALTSYIAHTEGPYLEDIFVILHESEPDWGPMIAALREGGLPNLWRLMICNIGRLALQQLGDVYRAGGLAKLTRLCLYNPSLEDHRCARGWTVCGAQSMGERPFKKLHFIITESFLKTNALPQPCSLTPSACNLFMQFAVRDNRLSSCKEARSGQPSFKPCETELLVPGHSAN